LAKILTKAGWHVYNGARTVYSRIWRRSAHVQVGDSSCRERRRT